MMIQCKGNRFSTIVVEMGQVVSVMVQEETLQGTIERKMSGQ